VLVIAAPTGTGKSTAMAKRVAEIGSTCWLTNRHEDVISAALAIEMHGGSVGRVVPLDGEQDGERNCLHPHVIEQWQAKGYSYRAGFCRPHKCCEREANPNLCPFLKSMDELKEADTIVVTKALALRDGFFSRMGNPNRETVVLDEDPIGLLRPLVRISRDDLRAYLDLIGRIEHYFEKEGNQAAKAEAAHSRRIADWCWHQISQQPPNGDPSAVPVPDGLKRSRPVLSQSKRSRRSGRRDLNQVFFQLMRKDPVTTVRNVARDLRELLSRSAGQVLYATSTEVFFHVKVKIPRTKRVFVLDATASPELLQPVFAPRPVRVVCDERVEPAGRVIQLMDFNGPRSYLNKLPNKLTKIIDAIGDLHHRGAIVLISHKSCVEKLKESSRHRERIVVAHFGAVRGRNDLEPGPDRPVACHIVVGSPKTTEADRRQLALAVYGKAIMPFPQLQTIRRAVVGTLPYELVQQEGQECIWEVRLKGYADPRMQAVYQNTVTAELTHAADRARVLIHKTATVYLVTNESCPKLWFSEKCLANDLLNLSGNRRSDFETAYKKYESEARELLDGGRLIGNADVCRGLNRKPGWGKRYWHQFMETNGDAVVGEKKVRWKDA
jgi:hypothetical protein